MSRSAALAIPTTVRRRRPNAQREKTSLSIRADVLEAAREIVKSGEAENLSALVEIALEEKLKRSKRAALYDAYAEASRNSAFMNEMHSVTQSFESTVNDGL